MSRTGMSYASAKGRCGLPDGPRGSRGAWAMLGALAVCGALGGSACGLPTGDLVVYAADAPELANASVDAIGVWESSPWDAPDAPWLSYPSRVSLQVEHTLGRTPRVVNVYLSFEQSGAESAAAAGDLARVVLVDDTTITIRNDTNAEFFVRIVAF